MPGPNGIRFDRLGRLWAASVNDGRVYVFDSDGRRLRRLIVPANRATSLEFGSPGSRMVYITSGSPGYVSVLRLDPNDPLVVGLP